MRYPPSVKRDRYVPKLFLQINPNEIFKKYIFSLHLYPKPTPFPANRVHTQACVRTQSGKYACLGCCVHLDASIPIPAFLSQMFSFFGLTLSVNIYSFHNLCHDGHIALPSGSKFAFSLLGPIYFLCFN